MFVSWDLLARIAEPYIPGLTLEPGDFSPARDSDSLAAGDCAHCARRGNYWCFRNVFNAPPQAMTWSNISLTDFSCRASGLRTEKFSKSVNMESKTWLRTV